MKGDFTRLTFDPHKHYSRVLMQQGRVQLDADWNEMVEMQLHFLRALAADLIGPHGGPGDSFKINPMKTDTEAFKNNFAITPGHYYVDGILCVNEIGISDADHFLYMSQDGFLEDVFGKLENNKQYIVYLDVWERHVTYIEDTDESERTLGIREVALRGPDTTTRTQIVWQVKCIPITTSPPPDFKDDYEGFINLLAKPPGLVTELSSGQLRARARKPFSGDTDPCLTSPEARYRGAENQLYRVEIHRSGNAWDGTADGRNSAATFKWSRENGAVIFPIEEPGGSIVTLAHLGHDDRFGLRPDDWVEMVNDDYILQNQNRAEPLRQIKEIDADTLRVTFKPIQSAVGQLAAKHLLLRRWDQHTNVSEDGVVLIVENSGDEDSAWIHLEDGVQIQFPPSPPGSGPHIYRTGDYWLIPARVATGDVEWPGQETSLFL